MTSHIIQNKIYKEYDLEQIFIDILYQQLRVTPELEEHMLNHFQIEPNAQFGLIGIWLGKAYEDDCLKVKEGLETFELEDSNMKKQVLYLPLHKMVLCILFPMAERRKYPYFQNKVQNDWSLFTPECSIFVGERCKQLSDFPKVLDLMISQLDWNLVLGSRILINEEKINKLHITPLRYLSEFDGEIEKILLQKDIHRFSLCFQKLWLYCRQEIHTPEAIKSIFLRYALVITHVARINEYTHDEIALQRLTKSIVNAIYWYEIWEAIYEFSIIMLKSDDNEKKQSLLVVEAKKLMIQHYSTGITLEEIAQKLHVTEEYLSTVFKKDTGTTFSETIRTYRINRVKELLRTSKLSIHNIAQLAGYSDGKYMSRVFKEMTGMSPNEYRKARAD